MIELVVTHARGESWRCQAIQSDGTRCIHPAVCFTTEVRGLRSLGLCSTCKGILDAGAKLRVNTAAGVDTKAATVHAGPFDGEVVELPADFRVGDTWVMDLESTEGQRLGTHLYRFEQDGQLHHAGPVEVPPTSQGGT